MRACETALRDSYGQNRTRGCSFGAGAGITRYAQQEWGRGRNHAADEDKNGAGDETMLPTKKPKKGAGGTEPHTTETKQRSASKEREKCTAGRYRTNDMIPPGDTGLMQ